MDILLELYMAIHRAAVYLKDTERANAAWGRMLSIREMIRHEQFKEFPDEIFFRDDGLDGHAKEWYKDKYTNLNMQEDMGGDCFDDLAYDHFTRKRN